MSRDNLNGNDIEEMEYVLGLLDQDERKAFERDLLDDPELAATVWDWEERFAPMADALQAKRPPASTFGKISARLYGDPAPSTRRRSRMGRDLAYLFGTLAAAAVAALVVVLVQIPGGPTLPLAQGDRIFSAAIVEADGAIVLAVVSPEGTLAVQPLSLPPEGSAELWLVTDERDPISVGLLDAAAQMQLPLADDLRPLLRNARFVITAEPEGGAPGGRATGPAIAQGELIEF